MRLYDGKVKRGCYKSPEVASRMIGLIAQLAKTFLSRATETREEKHKLRIDTITAEQTAVADPRVRTPNKAAYPNTDGLLRWAAFLLFASPLIAGLISPEFGQRVLRAWHLLEPWQEKILSGMCLATFGMRSIPNLIGGIVDSIRRK